MTKTIRIGSGAGYAGDRLEPSLELIEKGNLDYISYECLAERTIAIGQQAKLKDPSKGYNGLLEHRMEKALPLCWKHKVKLITNMGSANPQAAAQKCVEIARRHGLTGMKIPLRYVCEMVCDRVAASQIYLGDKYTDASAWEYYQRSKDHYLMHPETRALLEKLLCMVRDLGRERTFAYMKFLLGCENDY